MNDGDFIAVRSDRAYDNWFICSTGTDRNDGADWFVTTNNIHGSDLPNYSRGAMADAFLIARLLNWYHNNKNAETVLRKAEE